MQKLNFKQIKFKAKVITPIHIWSGQVWDRLDYFIFEWWEEVQIVKRQWLNHCASEDPDLFQKILKSIEKGDFVELENLKRKYYDKYFDPDKFLIEEIPISEEAMKHLTMQDKNYSNFNKQWFRWNLWEVKRFSFNKFWKLIIPWSTLKGFFRTMFLMDLVNQEWLKYNDIKNNVKKNNERFFDFFVFTWKWNFNALKDPLAWISLEDIELNNSIKREIRLIKIRVTNKKTKKVSFIPVVCEMITEGEFDIILDYSDLYQKNARNSFDLDNMKYILSDYSKEIKKREKINIENVLRKGKFSYINFDFLDWDTDNSLVKIWQFKREYTYKIYWNPKHKKLAHIDSFYIDESGNPVWWISLEILNK